MKSTNAPPHQVGASIEFSEMFVLCTDFSQAYIRGGFAKQSLGFKFSALTVKKERVLRVGRFHSAFLFGQ